MDASGKSMFRNIAWQLEYQGHEKTTWQKRPHVFLALAFALFLSASTGISLSPFNEGMFISIFSHDLFEVLFLILSSIILYEIYHEYLLSRKESAVYLFSAFFWMGTNDFLCLFSARDLSFFIRAHALSAFIGSLFFLLCSVSLTKDRKVPLRLIRYMVLFGVATALLIAYAFSRRSPAAPYESTIGASYWIDVHLPALGKYSISPPVFQILAIAGFLLSCLIFLKHYRKSEDIVFLVLSASAFLFAQNELFFGISGVWSLRWWCWHVTRLAILTGLTYIISFVIKESFYNLHESRERFKRLADEVGRAYENLRNTQEKLIETEELASIGRFAAIISHEIRNPLGAIKNAVGVFKNRLWCSPKDAELLDIIEKEINRLNKIISDFLDFSRPTQFSKSLTSLHATIEVALSLLSPSGQEDSVVRVEKEFDEYMPRFYMDRDAMKQVFWNIFMNCLQAMPEGGILKVKTFYREQIINSKRYREASIVVTDTGIGISEGALTKVFLPFFTTKTRGSGLGMSIVQRIIRYHGGNIYISSSEGKGTAVEMNLPVE
jgi:signal transduction histidine kinase